MFNLCDIAGVVQGIEEIKGDPNYLYEVKYDIHLENSVLYGNFFHYVKFNGMVNMDDTIVQGSFSCFRCLFDGFVYMQRIHLQGGFEQCEFNQGLIMSGAVAVFVDEDYNRSTSFCNAASMKLRNLDASDPAFSVTPYSFS